VRVLSDPEARVGRDGKSYDLGYKAHIGVDADSDIPVAVVSASAKRTRRSTPRSSWIRRSWSLKGSRML
jgi:hypothetical protein